MKTKIEMFHPYYNGKRIQEEIKKFFPEDCSNKWIGQAKLVDKFEQKFKEKFKLPYCLMTNSGTSALQLAYHLIGIGEGDEVITPVLTCVATQTPLLHKKAKIVFADIKMDNLTIDPEDVRRKITKKTKAIIAVTLGGIPIDKRIFELGKEYKIPIVVDSCQSPGYNKGDYIAYSFQAIKHITTCDGGMLVLNNKKEYRRAKCLRWFGVDREQRFKKGWKSWEKRKATYEIEEPGFKMQPTDLDALLGLIGLEDFDKVNAYRQELVNLYKFQLVGLDPLITLLDDSESTNWLFGILVEDRDKLANELDKQGIDINLVHLRNDIFKIFGGKRQDLPNMNLIEPDYLYLPLHNKLTKKQVRIICGIIRRTIREMYNV